MTRPAEGGTSRRIILPSVDLPLPLSPMSETTSPRSMPKAHLLQSKVQRRPRRFRTCTSSRPFRSGACSSLDLLGLRHGLGRQLLRCLPARHLVALFQLDERGLLGALIEGERASIPEPAARWWVEQRRRPARDPDQDGVRVATCPPRAGMPAASAYKGGADALTIVSASAFSASFPAYMTRMLSAIWARIDRSWVITIMLFTNPRSPELHQHLPHRSLGRDVQRGGDLVRYQQARGRAGWK